MSKNDMKLIMEGWRHSLEEMNAAASGVVAGPAAKDEQLDETLSEEELMEGFMDTLKKGAIGGALAMGLAGAPADAQASTPTSGGEQTTQQAQVEYDSTQQTVGFLHAYAKHLKGKPGVELRDRHNITMKWLPIQKAVYDLGPEKALSSDRLDNDQQELLQLVLDKVGSLDAEMLQYYGEIGSGITMNESNELRESYV